MFYYHMDNLCIWEQVVITVLGITNILTKNNLFKAEKIVFHKLMAKQYWSGTTSIYLLNMKVITYEERYILYQLPCG